LCEETDKRMTSDRHSRHTERIVLFDTNYIMFLNKIGQFSLVLTVAAIGLFAGNLKAQAGVLVAAPTDDTAFNQLISSGQFTEKFVTSARIGNGSMSGDYEQAILKPTQAVDGVSGQHSWSSGVGKNFSLQYDGTLLTYVLDGKTLTSTSFTGNASDIFFRTRAAANSSVLLSNLTFTDTTSSFNISDMSSGNGSSTDVDYLRIGKVNGAFTLTGTTTMSWTGARPGNSALIAQFKVGNSVDVPEPATLGALAVVAGGAIAARRKRQQG
jgi:hypothetical protein